ncbi:MAG: PorP/SprF family type IX secretion system membrane protein [Bacteroidota bacterium]
MRRFSYLFVVTIILVISTTLTAQDKHFTQYFAVPTVINPALTGAFQGRYRMGIVRRDQWRQSLETPYATFAGAVDVRFDTNYKKKVSDAVGVGLQFFNDKVDDSGFRTTQMALAGAFHKALDDSGLHYLTIGGQMAINQRSVNYENLTFEDQYNGVGGYTLPTGELLPENNFSFFDMAIGVNYTFSPSHRTNFYIGGAIHHLAQPNVSFLAANPDVNVSLPEDNKLFRKYSAQFAARFPAGEQLFIIPRALMSIQGPHIEINAGSNVRIAMGDYTPFALHIGGWARPVRNADETFGLDAIVAMVGIEFDNLLFGFSYDLNLDDLALAGPNRTAFEISVAYLGNFENEEILCPKF